MKRNFFAICALWMSCLLQAAPRTPQQALAAARAHLLRHSATATLRATATPVLAATSSTLLPARKTDIPAFYIYNQDGKAFVIVSGDDRMPEILGYSEDCPFVTENMPDNVRNWLGYYADVFDRLPSEEEHATGLTSVSVTKHTDNDFASSVSPLLRNIQYNQDAPYNQLCPQVNGQNSVTGCVATAIAQIMRYWQWPASGQGTADYTTRSLGLRVTYDFESNPFEWEQICPTYFGEFESDKQIKAVANLMLACGAACQMDYTTGASGAYDSDMFLGLSEHLGYAPDYIAYKTNYTPDEWMSIVKTELNASRPIYYSGQSTQGGHAFVVDGYDTNDKVHVNWGWGGYCNGYFDLLTLNSNGAGIGGFNDGSYQFSQMIFVGLEPNENKTQTASQFTVQTLTPDKDYIAKGVTFSVAFTHLYNRSNPFSGEIGLILDGEDNQHVLTSFETTLDHGWGWSENAFYNVKIPATISNGTYKMYMASRAKGEKDWQRVHGPAALGAFQYVVISDGSCRVAGTPTTADDLDLTLTSTHSFYTGYEAGIEVTVTNNGDDYFCGENGIAVFDDTDETMVAYWKGQQLQLASGESVTYTVKTNVNLNAGEYIIHPAFSFGHDIYYSDTYENITVLKPTAGTPTLKVSNIRLQSTNVESGSELNVSATLSISGTGSVNTTQVYHHYYRMGSNEVIGYAWDLPFVEAGQTSTLSLSLPVSGEPGTYVYEFYTYPNYEFTRVASRTFRIVRPTAIGSVRTDEEAQPFILRHEDNGDITVCSNATVERIRLLTMSGQVAGQTTPAAGQNGETTVKTGSLPRGTYLMQVVCGNKTHTIKFIR
ncbi:MAG: C10 family peptidase [Clostridium sp.]|nr:C10 family peptidase [Clostridium sp.]